jgi:membrane protein implicated in regulation of membrane protease activity
MLQFIAYWLNVLPWYITLGLFFLVVLLAVLVARPFFSREYVDRL